MYDSLLRKKHITLLLSANWIPRGSWSIILTLACRSIARKGTIRDIKNVAWCGNTCPGMPRFAQNHRKILRLFIWFSDLDTGFSQYNWVTNSCTKTKTFMTWRTCSKLSKKSPKWLAQNQCLFCSGWKLLVFTEIAIKGNCLILVLKLLDISVIYREIFPFLNMGKDDVNGSQN